MKAGNQEQTVYLTDKGRAVLAAIDSGLAPETNGAYDLGKFEAFWTLYTEYQQEANNPSQKGSNEPRNFVQNGSKQHQKYLKPQRPPRFLSRLLVCCKRAKSILRCKN